MALVRPKATDPVPPDWQSLLRSVWLERGVLARLLWPASWLYGLLVGARRKLYQLGVLRTNHLPVPVIVVGNVLAGGTGKTPVVMALVAHLQSRGWHVGVISRGYGRLTSGCREVTPTCRTQDVGDEPALIRRRTQTPVFVAEVRSEAAHALLQRYPHTNILVSDDGLQHLSLARDIEIGVFDDRGVGNGWLLPAGPLREPWPRTFDLTLHTGARPAFAGFQGQRRLADYALRFDGSKLPLSDFIGQPIVAVAAIAQPEAFFSMLHAQGLTLARVVALPDHHDFRAGERFGDEGGILFCTEKDAVKLWPYEPAALAVPLEFTAPPGFWQALDEKLGACPK